MPRVRLLLFVGVMLASLAALFAVAGRHDYESLQSFHVIADVSQVETGPASSTSIGPMPSRLEGWYNDGKARWEFTYSGPDAPALPTVQMTDGKTTYYYDATQNTYFEEPLIAPSSVAFLGIGIEPQLSIADLLRVQRKSSGFAGSTTEVGTYLGRKAEIVTTNVQIETGDMAVELKVQYTIDASHMFSLAYQVDGPSGTQRFAATEVQYNAPVSDDEFVFVPPATAQRIDPPVWSPANLTRMSAGLVDPPAGFFKPSRPPQGYRLVEQFTNVNDGQASPFTLRYGKNGTPGPGYLEIVQTPASASVPDDQRSNDVVPINDKRGYFTTIGGVMNLSWLRGNVLITLHSDELTRDQLLSVARSMR